MIERAEIFRKRQRFEHEQITPILPVVGQLQKKITPIDRYLTLTLLE